MSLHTAVQVPHFRGDAARFAAVWDRREQEIDPRILVLVGDHVESAGLPAATCAQNPTSKKLPETDDIFANLRQVHTQAANDPDTLRISIDTKAKVKIGAFSRHRLAGAAGAVQAADHDMDPAAVLAPAGMLEVLQDQLHILFGTSRDTSDFVADALQLRRKETQVAGYGFADDQR